MILLDPVDDISENVTWIITLRILHQAFYLLKEEAEIFQNSEWFHKTALQNPVPLLHPSYHMYYPVYFWNPIVPSNLWLSLIIPMKKSIVWTEHIFAR